ncbi:sensor domain-containing protein [Fulvimarina endophytica]|nr:EAL domain-containing protein [Fulvimarina endophytica]
MSSGVVVVDADARIAFYNERAVALFKVDPCKLSIGQPWREFLRAITETFGWDETRFERAADNHATWMARSQQTRIDQRLADGSVLAMVCEPLADGGGVFTYDDVTDAANSARAHRVLELKAQHSERSFRQLVKGITDYAIYMLNVDGTVANWNAGAERAKGYTESEIVGQHYRAFYSAEDRAAGIPEKNLATALQEGRFEDEGPRYRKDGTSFIAHVVIDPIYEDDGTLYGFAKVTRDRTEQVRNAERIAYMARFDALTGLPNRTQFVEKLDAAIEKAIDGIDHVALVNIDLDGFKQINDTHGHAVGDALLKLLASRMSDGLAAHEVVGRFGGDEFVGFTTYRTPADLDAFLKRLHIALTSPTSITHSSLTPGASLGVAVYPRDADSREKLMNNADLAMYRAKASLLEKICFYTASMDEQARDRRDLGADMWTALEAGDQFFLHYQEQLDVVTGAICGYEALLRWQHPTRGLVSPAAFIPIAESCGAIMPLGDWVLEKACQAAADQDLPRIAVNVSPLQLGDVSLVDRLRAILLRAGLSPARLELEITESAVINDRERALHILRQIKAMGVAIAIDDFGTGYSSLETLRLFPFDRLKLDRSFTKDLERDPKAQAFVEAMLMLGRSLRMTVLAEGVERQTQMALLARIGCGEVQGFLFGKPRSLEQASLATAS